MFSIATGSLMLLLKLVTVVAENCNIEESLRLVDRDGEVLTGWMKTTNARVEYCLNNTWGTICDDYFDVDASRFLCQRLGLPYNYTGVIKEYGSGSGDIYDIFCSYGGDKCFLSLAENCNHNEDTGIRCYEEPECQEYQSRLVTDQVDHFGLVELCVNGLWRTVCLDGWDYRGTDIICHQLNFNGSSFPVSANELDVEFHAHISVHCIGTESDLGQCEIYIYRQCYEWGPAGAYCSHKECDSGAVTLVGGYHPYFGRVEFCYEGQWYTLCADDWEDTGEEARVICHGLGYNSASVVIDYYGGGEHPILPSNIQCDRTDRELSKCSTSPLDVSQCSRVAGVDCEAPCNAEYLTNCGCNNNCYSDTYECGCSSQCFSYGDCCSDVATTNNCIENECENGAVRLVGGEYDSIGAIEVCVSGIWGGVCQTHRAFNDDAAKVICRQLQFPAEGAEIINGSFFEIKRDFVLGGINCVGTESELLQCQHFPIGYHDCYINNDTPVISCKACNHEEVRLEGGEDPGSGYVEFCQNGTWERVCSDGWDIFNARVVCRQLNFNSKNIGMTRQTEDSTNSKVFHGPFHCSGSEQYLNECRHNPLPLEGCINTVTLSCTDGINSSQEKKWSPIVAGTLLSLLLVATTVTIVILWQKRRTFKRKEMETNILAMLEFEQSQQINSENAMDTESATGNPPQTTHENTQISCPEPPNINPMIPMYHIKHLTRGNFIIEREEVDLLQSIGQGQFGNVYKAKLKNSEWKFVAVKTMKGVFQQDGVEAFIEECMKMSRFKHDHVMSLIGVCLDTGSAPYLIMPYMANGSLLDHLKGEREKIVLPAESDEMKVTKVRDKLIIMCYQIASGMEYLATEKYIHRDLAARNCMMDDSFKIEIADFGLSEDIYAKHYFRQSDDNVKLPVKWMAPESLNDRHFSEKSDVWSYGITMWEIFSGGKSPYPEIHQLSLLKSLEEGYRMPQPFNAACSKEIYDIMRQCWEMKPKDRPTFKELCSAVSNWKEFIEIEINHFTEEDEEEEEEDEMGNEAKEE